jgi:hypothetical protein
MPVFTTLVLLFGTQLFALLTVGVLIIALICFWIFKGCILSSIEYKLDNIDITLMDPLVEILGYEINPENRLTVAKWTSAFYMIFAILLYYIRFGSIYLHNSIYDNLNIFKGFYQRGPTNESISPKLV